MCIEDSYKKLISSMSLSSLEKEKEALLNTINNLNIIDFEFYVLINKLELIYQTSLQKFKQTNFYKVVPNNLKKFYIE